MTHLTDMPPAPHGGRFYRVESLSKDDRRTWRGTPQYVSGVTPTEAMSRLVTGLCVNRDMTLLDFTATPDGVVAAVVSRDNSTIHDYRIEDWS